jgi:hypothetical protein
VLQYFTEIDWWHARTDDASENQQSSVTNGRSAEDYAASPLTIDGVEGRLTLFPSGSAIFGMLTLGQNCFIAGISSE